MKRMMISFTLMSDSCCGVIIWRQSCWANARFWESNEKSRNWRSQSTFLIEGSREPVGEFLISDLDRRRPESDPSSRDDLRRREHFVPDHGKPCSGQRIRQRGGRIFLDRRRLSPRLQILRHCPLISVLRRRERSRLRLREMSILRKVCASGVRIIEKEIVRDDAFHSDLRAPVYRWELKSRSNSHARRKSQIQCQWHWRRTHESTIEGPFIDPKLSQRIFFDISSGDFFLTVEDDIYEWFFPICDLEKDSRFVM